VNAELERAAQNANTAPLPTIFQKMENWGNCYHIGKTSQAKNDRLTKKLGNSI
jgi:hypothetical protein